MGLPGYFWAIPEIAETIKDCVLKHHRLSLCHYKVQWKEEPSGIFFTLATNAESQFPGKCRCKDFTTHKKDWWGREENKAIWREQVFQTITASIAKSMARNVRDIASPPSSIRVDTFPTRLSLSISPDHSDALRGLTGLGNGQLDEICEDTFPTDARIAQKERLAKMKELGLKPKKKAIHVEEGKDDCGDDVSGLGKDNPLFVRCLRRNLKQR